MEAKKGLLSKIGPGFIVASTTIGAGTVVSYTNAGANFGYSLTWWIVAMLLFLYLFNYGMRKYTVVTGKTLMAGIYSRYGKVWAAIVGITSLVGQIAYAVGNFMAVGLGINMLFPMIPVKVGGCIGLLGCIAMYFLKNLYKKTEIIMKICIGVMVAIFIVSFFTTIGMDNGTVSHSLMPRIPNGSFTVMLALFGTTAALATQAWASSLTKDKGYTAEDVTNGSLVVDVLVQVLSIGIISGSCFFIGANLLGGSPISNAGELAGALAGQIGGIIRPLFGIGFLAAAFSSQIMAPKLGVNLLLEGFGREAGVENRLENMISIAILIFGAVLGCTLGSAPVSLLTAAQIGGIISTPILGILTILLLNSKEEMGKYKIRPYYTALLLLAYVVSMATIINNLIGIIR